MTRGNATRVLYTLTKTEPRTKERTSHTGEGERAKGTQIYVQSLINLSSLERLSTMS